MAEEKYKRIRLCRRISADLSSQSSIPALGNSQAQRIPAARCSSFPHFHSDDYYYGLYPSYKTG
jgi:hypothetical protein